MGKWNFPGATDKVTPQGVSSRKETLRLLQSIRMVEPTSDGKKKPVLKPGSRTRRRFAKNEFMSREMLDGRTFAAKAYDKLLGEICRDLGGRDQLNAIELGAVESLVGAIIVQRDLNVRMLIELGKGDGTLDTDVIALHRRVSNRVESLADMLLQRHQPESVPDIWQRRGPTHIEPDEDE